jgi:hypothetical protein
MGCTLVAFNVVSIYYIQSVCALYSSRSSWLAIPGTKPFQASTIECARLILVPLFIMAVEYCLMLLTYDNHANGY